MNDIFRPVSRLPRPIVSDRSRTRGAVVQPSADYGSASSAGSLPLIDVQRQQAPSRKRTRQNSLCDTNTNTSSSNNNNNGDMLFHESIGTSLSMSMSTSSWQERMSNGGYRRTTPPRDALDRRPQTSSAEMGVGAAYRRLRKTSSGQMHILKKLQTLSLGNDDRESLAGTATFARFQPLPAIERPSSVANISRQEHDQRPDSSQSVSSSEVATMSRFSEEQQLQQLRPLSSTSEVDGLPSAGLRTGRPDSGVIRESLVRSRTYDIITTASGRDYWTIQEEEDKEQDATATAVATQAEDVATTEVEAEKAETEAEAEACTPAEVRSPCGEQVLHVADDEDRLLLAIRLPSEEEADQIYGYFSKGDKVETILNFVQQVTGVPAMDCGVSYKEDDGDDDDDGQQRLLDLQATIGETAITNRTVLNIVRTAQDDQCEQELMESHSESDDEKVT